MCSHEVENDVVLFSVEIILTIITIYCNNRENSSPMLRPTNQLPWLLHRHEMVVDVSQSFYNLFSPVFLLSEW